MNKNDKFHGLTPPDCENNVNELSDDELDAVSGGWDGWGENLSRCPLCHRNLVTGNIDGVLYKICPDPQNHFKIKA